ncbi:SHOCT domain-containing protein [Natrialbaceae archaeon GCM10025810]|uniref:SHOCT domain-containing protein n=1 Tax=Halovalidus salilacus TaxID=3075124 RepID=UPI00361DB186
MSLPTFDRTTLMWLVAILSFGMTALVGAAAPLIPVLAPLSGMIFVLGFFILLPLIWLLGDDFPLVEPEGAEGVRATDDRPRPNPVAELRDRYATGELTEAEFERRLERLLETEGLEDVYEERRRPMDLGEERRRSGRRGRDRDRTYDLE